MFAARCPDIWHTPGRYQELSRNETETLFRVLCQCCIDLRHTGFIAASGQVREEMREMASRIMDMVYGDKECSVFYASGLDCLFHLPFTSVLIFYFPVFLINSIVTLTILSCIYIITLRDCHVVVSIVG
jgi:hypothetical protein